MTKKDQELPKKIGSFTIIKRIATGGMGEIFLAEDPKCKRQVALKRIRPELFKYKILRKRFLKEAFITAKFSHPTIIPIYSIYKKDDSYFYTMPYVEGDTLKEVLRSLRQLEGKQPDPNRSLHSLLRIFLSVTQAVSYIHSLNIIHRDIKPENILVGKYGEVLILDWGLAKYIGDPDELSDLEMKAPYVAKELTQVGKIVGTPSYLAPERANKAPADHLSDIYSLGVILYYILALKLPFKRESVKDFTQKVQHEVLDAPSEVAPYRDIPKVLEKIAQKSLAADPKLRYQSVNELLKDMQGYFEGRSEWFPVAELDLDKKSDWEFQESILLTRHLALMRQADSLEWVNLMISKSSFPGNIMLQSKICIKDSNGGIGFLLSVPEKANREQPSEGFCIWLGSSKKAPSSLFRSSFKILEMHDCTLTPGQWHDIKIEKVDNHLYLHVDGICKLSYIYHTPQDGTHVGILLKTSEPSIEKLNVFSGSQSVKVSCLAVPDAFLSQKMYDKALSEYRRIGYSFQGRAEGRDGLFRAGVTLLEKAKDEKNETESKKIFQSSLEEFEELRASPGAPLEYLGKSLVYQSLHDNLEEVKCLELALRKYRNHPLIPIFREHIAFRLQESSYKHRKATIRLMLLISLFFPQDIQKADLHSLFQTLHTHWEVPYFFPKKEDLLFKPPFSYLRLFLSFWTGRATLLLDLAEKLLSKNSLTNQLFISCMIGLYELGEEKLVLELVELGKNKNRLKPIREFLEIFPSYTRSKLPKSPSFEAIPKQLKTPTLSFFYFLYFDHGEFEVLPKILTSFPKESQPFYEVWTALVNRDQSNAMHHISNYKELLGSPTTVFFQGCMHALEGGKQSAIRFFQKESLSLENIFSLAPHFVPLSEKKGRTWEHSLVPWERKSLYRQLALFYHCMGKSDTRDNYLNKITRKQFYET